LKRFRGLVVYVLLALVAGLVSSPAHAQVAGATLSGTVTDTSGAVVVNAMVSVKNTATGVVHDVTTDTAGLYSVPNLLPGVYDVTFSSTGFSTAVQSGLTLTVGASKALNVSLQVGQVSDRVEVTVAVPSVELTSSTISGEVDSTTEHELPLNGRDWTQLATLQPGVTGVRVENGASNRGNRGYGTLLTISGHQPYENNYRINGISINDYSNGSPGSSLGVNLGVDAVQEFSVLTGNYSAEYGRASGGVINGITKSGTNQFHGDAYYFVRDKVLDARNYFDPSTIPPFHRDQFGVSGGAPILKGKTFIFGDYESIRQRKSDTFSNLVPSLAARGIGTGAGGGAGPATFCSIPQTPQQQPPNGCTTNQLATGSSAPATADPTTGIDKAVLPYLAFYPLPNSPAIGNGDTAFFNTTGVERLDENYVTLRVDHHFSDKDSFAGSWFYDRAPLTIPDSMDYTLTQNFTLRQMYSLEETHVFNPNLVNTARFGFSRVRATVTQPITALNPLAKDPSFGILPGRFAPQINVGGLVGMVGALGAVSADLLTWNSFQFYDDVFITHGTHTLKFGFAVEHMQNSEFSGGVPPNGQFNFGGLQNFLTNVPDSINIDDASTTRPIYVHQNLFGFYAQDDWRVRSNLTLNFGVRYEPVSLPVEAHNTFAVMTTLSSPAETPVNTFWAKNQSLLNFAPRVGFAWDPFRDGKTAVRAGFGIYDALPLSWVFTHGSTGVLPYQLELDATNLPPGSFPNGAVTLAKAPSSKPGVRLIEQDPKRNYALNWNLNIQREITPSLTAVVAYVGSHTIHSPFSTDDSNMVIPTLTSQGYLWPCGPDKTGTPCVSGFSPNGTQNAPLNTPVNNPSVGRIRATWWGNTSSYHGLQASIGKTMSHGFQFQGSYTWSKCLDNGSGGMLGDPYANSLSSLLFFDPKIRHGVCDFNIGQNFVANYLWKPTPPKFGGVAGEHILGGWEVGGVIVASTGSPFTAVVGGDPLGQNSTDAKDFVSRVAGPGCDNPINPGSVTHYIKVQCFGPPVVPASFAGPCVLAKDGSGNTIPNTCMNLFGNNGRNTLVGPGLINVDFSVFKNNYVPRISEAFNVQFRAEFFNVLNHPNFQAPIDTSALLNKDGSPANGAGAIDTTSTPSRQIQFGLKVIW
jgi:Carboxypeptidase regulatory-like domain/TonB-dependent Receptor Plug Domain/TonB dependent receptor